MPRSNLGGKAAAWRTIVYSTILECRIVKVDRGAIGGRLEALGAKRLRQVRTWWIMEAPTGHRFCVVRPQGATFASEANRWE